MFDISKEPCIDMSVITTYIYSLYCLEEATTIYPIVNIDGVAPTLCPHDHANRTNIAAVTLVKTVSTKSTILEEQVVGLYETKSFEFAVPSGTAGDVTSFDVTFPTDIEIWDSCIDVLTDNIGDQVTFNIAPETTIGVLTAPVSSGTLLNVLNATVASPNVFVGANIILDDTVTTQDLGQLISKDTFNNQMTVQNAVSNSFAAGTAIKQSILMLDNFKMSSANRLKFGRRGFKSKTVPAGTIIRVLYTNNSGTAKNFYANVEFYKT